ncbi:arf-GAP with dual PH domain-containing protein 1 isoform X2 [Hydra vulgaris]|uniref:Arf-GAP with dual PH domain-containing protein 1 isoform X2 n=1 Tax=Hydra vulgaris TaxID=6087 RepID=A0ABM4CCV4_HYDVU
MTTTETYKLQLLNLRNTLGNEKCADCGTSDPPPDFVSINIGIFLCINCAGKHRAMGEIYSVVRSIHLDSFDEKKYEVLEQTGNRNAAKIWEFSVPLCWSPPLQNDYEDLVEQWIHAKYIRKEFVENADSSLLSYLKGTKTGWLFKKEKDASKWRKRFFVLSSQQGQLSYFIREDDNKPKRIVQIRSINMMFVSEEITQKKHSMLITFPFTKNREIKLRHIYLHSETSFEIVDWYLSLRAARLSFLKPYLYGLDGVEVSRLLNRSYIKMGFLHKTGSKKGDGWRKRFVCLDCRRFLYFSNAMDPEPLGDIKIESSPNNQCLFEGVNGTHPASPTPHCFYVRSSVNDSSSVKETSLVRESSRKGRNPVFNFCSETNEDMKEWISAFNCAMKSDTVESVEPDTDSQRTSQLFRSSSSSSEE